jgi:hypothetical protein
MIQPHSNREQLLTFIGAHHPGGRANGRRDAEYRAVTRLQAEALVTVDARIAATVRDAGTVANVGDLPAPG